MFHGDINLSTEGCQIFQALPINNLRKIYKYPSEPGAVRKTYQVRKLRETAPTVLDYWKPEVVENSVQLNQSRFRKRPA